MEKGFFDPKILRNNLVDKVRPQPKETERVFVVRKTKNPC